MTAARLLSVNVTADLHEGAAWTGAQGRSGIDKRPFDGPRLLAGDAVQGDSVINRKHHGGPWQAVYAYAREDADWWETRLGIDIPSGSFGENLTTAGADLTNAPSRGYAQTLPFPRRAAHPAGSDVTHCVDHNNSRHEA